MFTVGEAYERDMGRWSKLLASLFVEFVVKRGGRERWGLSDLLRFWIEPRRAEEYLSSLIVERRKWAL